MPLKHSNIPFFDDLVASGMHRAFCVFASLVLTLPTGNAISESGFSLMNFTKSRYRGVLREGLVECTVRASSSGISLQKFARVVAPRLAAPT